MSDHERGAYTPPTDAPLTFDARKPVRGARPFPLTLVVSVLVLLGLAGAIFVFYRSGVRQAGAAPQVVGTPVGGLKGAAPAEAQPQDAAAGLEIYRQEPGQPPQMAPNPPQFTAPPEQPQARPQPGPPVVVIPPAAAPQAPPAVQSAELRPAQSAPAPQPVALPAGKPPTAPAAAPPRAVPAPAPKVAEEKPKAALDKPKAVAEKPKAPAAAEKPTATASVGGVAVQIGAVSSPALADKTWNDAVALAPGLAVGKGKGVERIDRDGKVLFRTSVTGFASRDTAQAFCAKLKTAGKACFIK